MTRFRLALLLPLAGACAHPARTGATALAPGQSVTVQSGATISVVGAPVRIRVDAVNDSRCPSDVTCVTAGDAMVALHLAGGESERRDTLRLVTPPREVRYAGFTVYLADVTPYPVSTARERMPLAVLRVVRTE